jgi:hypothetical protein
MTPPADNTAARATREPWAANRPTVSEVDVLEAFRTVGAMRLDGSQARDVAGYLGCRPTWDAIEIEMRRRLAEDRVLRLRPAAA